MLVQSSGDRSSTYKGARWTDPVPALLREHLAKAFTQQYRRRHHNGPKCTAIRNVHLGKRIYANSRFCAITACTQAP